MMDIFKLTDFGDQSIILGSRAVTAKKYHGLDFVRKDWLNNVEVAREYLDQFKTDYGFDEQAFLKEYSLRAVQFGNWMDYGDRADHFIALVQALNHLSRILGTKNLGYNANMSIAIGARGRSKALAHFEPLRDVINLTKEKGGHSFAHEYGHAIDFMSGKFFSKTTNIYSLSDAHSTSTSESNGRTDEVRNLMKIVIDGVRSGERYNDLVKWSKEKGSYAYWCNNTEIWARTFAQWVALQCQEKKIKDTVLSAAIDDGTIDNVTVKELKALAPYIKKLVVLNTRFLNTGIKPPAPKTKNPFENNGITTVAKPKKKAAALKLYQKYNNDILKRMRIMDKMRKIQYDRNKQSEYEVLEKKNSELYESIGKTAKMINEIEGRDVVEVKVWKAKPIKIPQKYIK